MSHVCSNSLCFHSGLTHQELSESNTNGPDLPVSTRQVQFPEVTASESMSGEVTVWAVTMTDNQKEPQGQRKEAGCFWMTRRRLFPRPHGLSVKATGGGWLVCMLAMLSCIGASVWIIRRRQWMHQRSGRESEFVSRCLSDTMRSIAWTTGEANRKI